uniref:GST D2 n=1 Tax=Tetranychus cinnabarinus TaxID=93129 RepID=A0A089YQ30_TETCI|nr:GST D2 [Tetranychus cinnabarinus]
MVLELYQVPLSPPCRQVRMVGKILNLPIETKMVDVLKGEHLKPEFVKINPFHCIPTLVDDGFALWESRAIMTYLVNKYAPESSLYPKDVKARATVDRWLYWDNGSLYAGIFSYFRPILFQKVKPDPANLTPIMDKFKLLDESLAKTKFLCGNTITLADLSCLATITTAKAVDLDISAYKNVDRWLKELESNYASWWKELVIDYDKDFRSLLRDCLA